MKNELESLQRHQVWDLVNRPKNKKVIKCKWIFNIKENFVAMKRKYKARLVALDCDKTRRRTHQQLGRKRYD